MVQRFRKKKKRYSKKFWYIQKSSFPKAGKGLFATKTIPRGTRLGYYKGKLLTDRQHDNLKDKTYSWEIDYPKGKVMYMDAKYYKKNNPLRYINGAKTKKQKRKINTEAYQWKKRIYYRTTKKVLQGQEFIIDYGKEYWQREAFGPITLKRQSSNFGMPQPVGGVWTKQHHRERTIHWLTYEAIPTPGVVLALVDLRAYDEAEYVLDLLEQAEGL